MITQSAHPDANIIWGTAFDERLADEMNITVVATGFENTPGVDEPIQAAMHAQMASKAAADVQPEPAVQQPAAPTPPPTVDPVIPSPVIFNTEVAPASSPKAAEPEEEDDGDYFNDLLSILNKRS